MAGHLQGSNLFNLTGETALVTGGTGHLGFAIASGLSEHGANVIIGGRDLDRCTAAAKKIEADTGNKCFAVELNISSREGIGRGMQEAARKAGHFNILFNNAAFAAPNSLEKMTEEEWQIGFDGTATATMYCMQEAIAHLEASPVDNRSIINIASIYGVVSPDPGMYGDSGFNNPPNYGAGKAAVLQLTRFAACHLASRKIRVNAISPGPFPNPAVQKNSWFIEQLEKKVPLSRIGQPEDLKGAAVFLASKAAGYVTGHNLLVDGGWTAW